MLFQGKKCGPNLSEAECPEKKDCLTGNILSNYPNKKRFHKVVSANVVRVWGCGWLYSATFQIESTKYFRESNKCSTTSNPFSSARLSISSSVYLKDCSVCRISHALK